MVAREAASLLPTSSCSVKNEKAGEGRFPIKRTLFWLRMTTLAFNFCWLAFLTFRSFGPEEAPVLSADVMRTLMTKQEVRCWSLVSVRLTKTFSRFVTGGSCRVGKPLWRATLLFVKATPVDPQLWMHLLPTLIDYGRVGSSSTSSMTRSLPKKGKSCGTQ